MEDRPTNPYTVSGLILGFGALGVVGVMLVANVIRETFSLAQDRLLDSVRREHGNNQRGRHG